MWSELGRRARELAEASIAPNTRAAYASALRRFDEWLAGRPATDETLAGYLAELFTALNENLCAFAS